MSSKDQDGAAFFEAVERAIKFGTPFAKRPAAEAFDSSAEHVAVLLNDAMAAFKRMSYGTAAFLAITAIEETAKAELLALRLPLPKGVKPKGRDPLRDHKQKHLISVRPTTFMGRLPALIGADACVRLQKEVESGDLVALRERAIYVHVDDAGLSTPATTITVARARERLLLALECADDILVGWTSASFEIGKSFERWIDELSQK